MIPRRLTVRQEHWPIAGEFRIARGAKAAAHVIVVELAEDGHVGRGEATPYARYGETPAAAIGLLESMRAAVEGGLSRADLQQALAPGAARNALDCALWDLEAKRTGVPVWREAGLAAPRPLTTYYTLSLDDPKAMAKAAAAGAWSHLKLKIDGDRDVERVAAVRAAAPDARLVVDANEALTFVQLQAVAPALADLGVELIEQPLRAGFDAALETWESPVPLCADESFHTRDDLERCARRYGCVNVKLDKAGGLTEALALAAEARARGLAVMAGCMVATSLAMAPAMLLAQAADYVDLDGALLLARDRAPGLRAEGLTIHPPTPAVWG